MDVIATITPKGGPYEATAVVSPAAGLLDPFARRRESPEADKRADAEPLSN